MKRVADHLCMKDALLQSTLFNRVLWWCFAVLVKRVADYVRLKYALLQSTLFNTVRAANRTLIYALQVLLQSTLRLGRYVPSPLECGSRAATEHPLVHRRYWGPCRDQ